MAEGVLFGVAQSILESLGSQALRHINLASNVRDEILKLTDTVTAIKDVLIDAEKQQNNNRRVKNWLERLRDVMYDADDLLDDFSTELLLREEMIADRVTKKVRIFFSKSNHFAYSLKMGLKIKAIRKKLDAIKTDQELLNLSFQRVETISNRETHSFVDEEDVIGREDDKFAIKKLLFESNDTENVSVIPIVGLGGMGKTTLVQFVYNDAEVKNCFQLKMWVCVTDVFDWKTIVEKIIRSATDKELEKLDEDQLQKRLRENIDGKKYLLVLDDVWNEDREKWHKLKTLLKHGARGSKIIVTTRSETVAKVSNKNQFHSLTGLPEDKSWHLFVQTMSKQGIELKDPKQVEIGKQIVTRCVGVPLVIRVVGNLLGEEGTNWESIRNYLLSNIVREDDISKPLKLSYDHLPSYLKQCFAYCGLFPQDYEFQKEELIKLWMAQGFLQPSSKHQFPEDAGDECFMNLLSRSFFQDVKHDEWGNIVGCKMHDLIHDLARTVAGTECTNWDVEKADERARHVICNRDSLFFQSTSLKVNHIRTFYAPPWLDESSSWKILSSFRCVRTLKLSNNFCSKLPDFISELKHLRYLDLSDNRFKKLPNSMCRLRNLETLGLSGCYALKELPRDIGNMVSLRHLINKGCSALTAFPKGVGLLTNLQTLSMFVVNKTHELNYLKDLNHLKGRLLVNISLRGDGENAMSTFALTELLKEKQYLTSLRLCWDVDRREVEFDDEILEALQPHQTLKELIVEEFWGLRGPNWLSSITNLTTILISRCKRYKHLQPLDQLPSLTRLELCNLDNLESISSNKRSTDPSSSSLHSTQIFPSLRFLLIRECPNLKGWWKSDDDDEDGGRETTQMLGLPSFACLSVLYIWKCPKLTSMPLYPSLEKLLLWDTSSKPLQQTVMMLMSTAAPSTSNFSTPLSKLQSLSIMKVNDLTSLPTEWLQNLTSLADLTIWHYKELESLDDDIDVRILKACDLTILRCKELELIDEETDRRFLRFDKKWAPWPKWIQCGCLHIQDCCSLMGLDWPKIAHIPNIRIGGRKIQIEGVYQLKG